MDDNTYFVEDLKLDYSHLETENYLEDENCLDNDACFADSLACLSDSLESLKLNDKIHDSSINHSRVNHSKINETINEIINSSNTAVKRYFSNTNTDDVVLLIDSREKKNNRNRVYFQDFLNNQQIRNATRFLGIGDFLWLKDEKIINYIVERKGPGDFIASISDGRYREQKRRLSGLGFRVFYILENTQIPRGVTRPNNRQMENENNSQAAGGMASSIRSAVNNMSNTISAGGLADLVEYCKLETKMEKMTVIETRDIKETGKVLLKIDKLVKENIVQGVAVSDGTNYGSFVEDGEKNCDFNGNTLLIIALLSIRGLRKDRAIELSKKYGSFSVFMREVQGPGFKASLAQTVVGSKEIGEKLAERIIGMFV
ncbi:crossover junction endonuclease MUS81 [Enteropsectra breve]|nr:crossover junction endonuclease MUS81 [Enteropsectra breve]